MTSIFRPAAALALAFALAACNAGGAPTNIAAIVDPETGFRAGEPVLDAAGRVRGYAIANGRFCSDGQGCYRVDVDRRTVDIPGGGRARIPDGIDLSERFVPVGDVGRFFGAIQRARIEQQQRGGGGGLSGIDTGGSDSGGLGGELN